MTIDPYIVLGSAIIGFLVGMTGAGGGALMTPMLILLFGVKPGRRDLERPRRGGRDAPVRAPPCTCANAPSTSTLVKWMVIGSVPMAFLGAYLLHLMGNKIGPDEHRDARSAPRCCSEPRAMVLRYVPRPPQRAGSQRPSSTTSSSTRCRTIADRR